MDADRWRRLQALFDQALALPAPDRPDFLERTEPDPGVRAEVMALLAADGDDDAVDRLVQRAAATVDAPGPAIGLQVGPWRVLDELGAGGMGTVFLAERADGAYERRVAIKFLRGIPTRDGAERMRRERQILADLDHPNIAGLLDGGGTAEGQPYLVMDYVEGVPITDYARSCTVDQRLRLLQQVARAVQFAHQRLVIHRDLKPANVLVRADGVPMLLDFGIAKLIANDAGAGDGQTQAWFTPGYASPEQRRGEPVSTAGDVYALGQLLAEVLSGEYRAPAADGTVPPPSARGLAGLPPRRLRELDAIVVQACAPVARDRYASAEALADDIERYFLHKPLRAAPARPLYLVRTFVRRHRLGVSASVLAVLALSAFTWRLASERDRALRAEAQAQQESATAEQVVQYLVSLFEAASPLQAGNRPILPADLVDRGRQRVDEVLSGQPQQQARLLGVLGRIDRELGRSEQAVASLQSAIAINRGLGDLDRVAEDLITVGVLENQNERPSAARPVLEEAIALLRGMPGRDALLADALGALALAQIRLGEGDAARSSAAEGLRLAEASTGPQSVEAAMALQVVAEVDSRTGQDEAAIGAASRSLTILRRSLPADHPDIATAIGFLANAYVQIDRHAEGEPLFREMLEIRLRTLDPGSAWVITARNNLAHAIYFQGRILEALPLMQENVDLLRARGEDATPSYLIALNNVASLHETTGRYAESVRLFRELYGKAVNQRDPETEPRMAQFRQNLGRSLMLAGDLDGAWPLLSADIPGSGDESLVIERGRRLLHMADWMRRSGRLAEVTGLLDQAQAEFSGVLAAGHPRLAAVTRVRGLLALDQGRAEAAVALLREALAQLEAVIGANANASIETRLQLATALAAAGDRGAARDLLATGMAQVEALFAPEAPIHDELRALRRRLGQSS